MNNEKVPSREEIVKLFGELPSKIERLLTECVGTPPQFVPNYHKFRLKAAQLLKPFAQYSDAMYHAGNYSGVYRTAMRVFATKKMRSERLLRKLEQQLSMGKAEAIEAFMRFKLLVSFFGYTEQYPGNINQIYDLEYRFENEKDPRRRRELLEYLFNIVDESSTGYLAKALLAYDSGNLDGALVLVERAIEKFPDNTLAYRLKYDILQTIAKKTIDEGLRREPRDRALRLAREIEDQLWKIREKCANGLLNPEVAIEQLELLVQQKIEQEGVELELYTKEVEKSLKSTDVIYPRTMKFLCTGEFLFSKLPKQLDYAPCAIEFCKAIENELYERLFSHFKSWCLRNLPEVTNITKESRPLSEFIYKGGNLTLGKMAMVLQFLGSRKRLKQDKLFQELKKFVKTFSRSELLLGADGVRSVLTPESVNMYRNSAAHLSEFTLKKAQDTKRWCYQFLNLLVKSVYTKPN